MRQKICKSVLKINKNFQCSTNENIVLVRNSIKANVHSRVNTACILNFM